MSYEPIDLGDDDVIRLINVGRKTMISVPTALVNHNLTNEEIGLFVRASILEECGEPADLPQLASDSRCSLETIEGLAETLCAKDFLTLGPVRAVEIPQWPPPPPAPPPPAEYMGGYWSGTRAELNRPDCPPQRVPVVYFLYDANDELAYIGSTDLFWGRIKAHYDKPWVRFTARDCNSRCGAYELEAVEIRRHWPYLNRDDGSLRMQGIENARARAGAA